MDGIGEDNVQDFHAMLDLIFEGFVELQETGFLWDLMHKGKFLSKRHVKHHRNFEAQGWWGEFTDYSLPGLLIVWAGFLHSIVRKNVNSS